METLKPRTFWDREKESLIYPTALANRTREIEDAVYDLKAVNPHCQPDVDTRTPEELIAFIQAKGREIAEALAAMRGLTAPGLFHAAFTAEPERLLPGYRH